MNRSSQAAALVLSLLTSQVRAQDFEAGVRAAKAGDYATAIGEWMPLAEQGEAAAQYNVGIFYSKGFGVPLSDVEAVRWFTLAADQGLPDAQFAVGRAYANGEGVPENYVEAAKWFRSASVQGNLDAQTALGGLYLVGEGVPHDYSLGYMWIYLGSAIDTSEAKFLLGVANVYLAPSEREAAQARAGICLASNYQICD